MKITIPFLTLFALFVSCSTGNAPQPQPQTERAIYHWKTTFNPTQWELQFLEDHHIDRIYLHLFDVVPNEEGTNVVPAATLRLMQPVPAGIEVVPTVYVSREAIDIIDNNFGEYILAYHIYDRVAAMMRCNGISYREIQLDCDGSASATYSTRSIVWGVLDRAHEDSIQVSTTIRLSQLANIDNLPTGVHYMLMLYNTGALQNPATRNSILDYNDAKPYLKYLTPEWLDTLAARGKHLDCAYPLYGWGVAFQPNGQFSHLVPVSQLPAQSSDTLRIEWGEMSAIRQVQQAMEAKMPSHQMGAIALYHLDSACLAHYRFEDVESIWNPTFDRKPHKQVHTNQ